MLVSSWFSCWFSNSRPTARRRRTECHFISHVRLPTSAQTETRVYTRYIIQAQEMPQCASYMSDNAVISSASVSLPQGNAPSNPQLHSESSIKPRDNEREKDNEKSPLSFTSNKDWIWDEIKLRPTRRAH